VGVGVVLLTILIVCGRRLSPLTLPWGATNSRVISAACHQPKEDKDAWLFPVQWGLIDLNKKSAVPEATSSTIVEEEHFATRASNQPDNQDSTWDQDTSAQRPATDLCEDSERLYQEDSDRSVNCPYYSFTTFCDVEFPADDLNLDVTVFEQKREKSGHKVKNAFNYVTRTTAKLGEWPKASARSILPRYRRIKE